MNATTAAFLPTLSCSRPYQPPTKFSFPISASLFRSNRRRRHGGRSNPPQPPTKPQPPPDPTIHLAISLDAIADRVSASVTRLYLASNTQIHRLIDSGADAYCDLTASVRVEPGHRIVFSCRRSSLVFMQNLLLWSLFAVFAVRALGSGVWSQTFWGSGHVVRRDRSLSGREVVVGRRFSGKKVEMNMNPVSITRGNEVKVRDAGVARRVVKREPLPKWWTDSVASPVVSIGKIDYQNEADKLVRAIMDSRMSGNDFKEDDIVELRRICRISGSRVSFETANARDSFYRAAVDLVLDSCSRVQPAATVLVDGEEARQFICGLACNIGLDNAHAARFVRAAVAARTRASFLQSWALEVQGRRPEALEELSKISRIYLVFPPDEYSPEMEMVAGGLKKNLGVEQREHLLDLFKGICGPENHRIAAEALGLMDFG